MNLNKVKSWVPNPLKRVMRRVMQNIWESARYHLTVKNFNNENVRHVVFVCKGNICRSAFAEHYLRGRISDDALRIDSCGLDVDQGGESPSEAIWVAEEFNIDLKSHRSKGFGNFEVEEADLILPMEYTQYLRLIAMFPSSKRKIRLLRDFAPWPERFICNISDPYGAGENEFRRCFRKLKTAIDGVARLLGSEGAQQEQ